MSTAYKILSSNLLWRLTPYAEKITGYHLYGFRNKKSNTDHLFCIRQILETKCQYNETVRPLFIDFWKAYDFVRKEALYNILIEFCILMKLVNLIKM